MNWIELAQEEGIPWPAQPLSCVPWISHFVLDSTVNMPRAGRPGFDSRQGSGCFLLATVSIPALEHTKLPIQTVPRVLFPESKLTTHFHVVPRFKNAWSYTSTPQYVFSAWCLIKQ